MTAVFSQPMLREEEPVRRPTKQERDDALVEDVSFMISTGEHPLRVAARLRKSCAAIEAAMRRLDRKDLAVHFYPYTKS